MLAIKNNLMAENTARQLGKSYNALAKSVERLSSGLRIATARDDAAGMAVSELLRADIAVIKQGSRNALDAVSMLQSAEGALSQIDDILVRMKELAEQASTGSYSAGQRTIMNNEYSQLSAEITRIAQTTTFNGIALLNTASTSTVSFHVGFGTIDFNPGQMAAADLGVSNTPGTKETWTHLTGVASADNQYINVSDATAAVRFSIGNVSYAVTLGDEGTSTKSLNWLVGKINTAAGTNAPIAFANYDSNYGVYRLQLKGASNGTGALAFISSTHAGVIDATADFGGAATITGSTGSGNSLETVSGATSALSALDTAINTKDTYRAKLGYMMNRLESAQMVLDIQAENLLAAKSRITDVDVATEMSALTRNQVLSQAGISMLAQAGQMPQMALSLLRG